MVALIWDAPGEKTFETGLSKGVLYPATANGYGKGVVWNGLTTISESPSGGEASPFYADNQKYLELMSIEEFAATIEAYTYPVEFGQCDGTYEAAPGLYVGQQAHKGFGLSYQTLLGDDLVGQELGFRIHLIYGARAKPSEKSRATVNDSPEPVSFSWEMTTTPIAVPGFKPSSHLYVDSTTATPAQLTALQELLYGSATTEPTLPLPGALIDLLTT